MEIYKDLSNQASKEFEQLLNSQLSKKNPINISDGYAKRFDNLINLDASKNKGKAIVSIFKAKKNKVPFIRENILMNDALKVMNKFNHGVLVVRSKSKKTLGIISDGDIKRISNKNNDIKKLITKNIMKINPISVDKNMIAAEALSIMNSKKVTCLCVHSKKNQRKTLGIITIHNILKANIQ